MDRTFAEITGSDKMALLPTGKYEPVNQIVAMTTFKGRMIVATSANLYEITGDKLELIRFKEVKDG